MIYLDSAATSLIKPPEVCEAVMAAMRECASPGRGSHAAAMKAADAAYECRETLAELFGVPEPERVVFTMNATHALNIAINTLVPRGGRAVISGYEHNSVTRPLRALDARVRVASSPLFEPEAAVEAFRRALPGADAAICCHVSNVFGYVLPVAEIARECRRAGVPLIIDASQSVGTMDIDLALSGAKFIAMPGHKGLLGPQGTGVLLCAEPGEPLIFGGTGSDSLEQLMPAYLPDRLEAGTHNICGIAGLNAGAKYVLREGAESIGEHERALCRLMSDKLKEIPGLRVFTGDCQSGVLSVVSPYTDSELAAERLGAAGIAVRAGMHCSPLAHGTAGTLATGTVRFSFSPFNTADEALSAAETAKKILGPPQ